MSRRQSTVLAFALAGALSLTVVSVPAAFAADAGAFGQVNAAAPLQADAGGFVISADGVLVGVHRWGHRGAHHRGRDQDRHQRLHRCTSDEGLGSCVRARD